MTRDMLRMGAKTSNVQPWYHRKLPHRPWKTVQAELPLATPRCSTTSSLFLLSFFIF
jgi:hypothetical protein